MGSERERICGEERGERWITGVVVGGWSEEWEQQEGVGIKDRIE